MKIIEGLKYSKDHEWVKVEGNLATVGITDYAQHSLGDIVFVELPEIGDVIGKEEAFGVVESVKAASDIYLPVSGTVVKINEALVDEPELLNTDAFENWMVCVEMDDPAQLDELMDAAKYDTICQD
ncbi:glycine cleavage system protein GcvH [Acetobacterium carbinolicum]|jgi:glycine cleavage system H protein|uniref:glycine cleavage system protein GcvH n=1 Tax=Acetobacterium TaxID=33951 RepID=UPI000DBEB039|nr:MULTISPECIES: glycine cleavage system protein GcvH [unclassified Acetobacterium]AWW26962.1 glycine cleavage system protein GcvH [Acetobacterium sp. KB-1]MDK2941340.1 glycine cleavage system protein [Acetobacterium sp.]MDZ5725585.1 glycine cleavage system protein GcvH [Acetobacterium sp. K1/6]